jgi:NADH:ubiquinone oxidoreductase subunit E
MLTVELGGFMLIEKYAEEIQTILAKYPPDQKRAAVMPLLFLAQREQGYVTKQAMNEIGEILGISSTDVASIVGFTLILRRAGRQVSHSSLHRFALQPCGAPRIFEKLCENLGIRMGETTPMDW